MKPSLNFAQFAKKRITDWHMGGKDKASRIMRAASRPALIFAACVSLSACAGISPHIPSLPDADKQIYGMDGQVSFEEAQAKIASMSDEELLALDHTEAVHLLNALIEVEKEKFDKAPIHRIYRALSIDQDYKDYYAKKQAAWYDYAKDSKLIEEARNGWAKAGDDRRQRWMQRILDKQAKFMGFDGPSVALIKTGPRDGCNSGEGGEPIQVTTQGYHMLGNIYLNTHEASKWQDFDEVLQLGVHENYHNFQFQLYKDMSRERIATDDPRWAQVALWVLNRKYYVTGCGNFATYWRQPLERDAFEQDYKFRKTVLENKKVSAPAP